MKSYLVYVRINKEWSLFDEITKYMTPTQYINYARHANYYPAIMLTPENIKIVAC